MTTAVDQELSKFRSCSMVDSVDELDEPVKLSFFEELQQRRDEYLERAHFYLTIFFSLLAICTAFVFVFLVAFVIEPAVTTMQMDFQLTPATCCVRSFVEESGADNCAEWSSCREGCTREVYQCVKITVAYTERANVSCSEMELRPTPSHWLYDGARLFPNVKGCGYPPALNCTVFTGRYGDTHHSFPCYYSRVDQALVITALDTEQLKRHLVIAIVVPFVCLVVSIVFLVHAYYRARAGKGPPAGQAESAAGDGTQPSCSKAPSVYSLRSISSRLNTSVVRFARDRYCSDSEGDLIELQPIGGDVDECQFLQPGRLPSDKRLHLLPPLESGPLAADDNIYGETSS